MERCILILTWFGFSHVQEEADQYYDKQYDYYQQQAEQYYNNNGENMYGSWYVQDKNDEENQGLIAMCTALYEASAQCDKNLDTYYYTENYKVRKSTFNFRF